MVSVTASRYSGARPAFFFNLPPLATAAMAAGSWE